MPSEPVAASNPGILASVSNPDNVEANRWASPAVVGHHVAEVSGLDRVHVMAAGEDGDLAIPHEVGHKPHASALIADHDVRDPIVQRGIAVSVVSNGWVVVVRISIIPVAVVARPDRHPIFRYIGWNVGVVIVGRSYARRVVGGVDVKAEPKTASANRHAKGRAGCATVSPVITPKRTLAAIEVSHMRLIVVRVVVVVVVDDRCVVRDVGVA